MNRFVRSGVFAGAILLAASGLASAADQESWDAIYVAGSKVGHTHVLVEPLKDKAGQDLVRVRVNWELSFERGNDRVRMSQAYGTIEKPDGEVLRLDTITKAADNNFRTSGDVKNGMMGLTVEAGGQKQIKTIPWGPDVRGPYAAELSLSRKKLPPGETREVKTYIPDLNKICTTKLEAKRTEEVEIGGKGMMRTLLRVEQTVIDDSGKPIPDMASTLWIDDSGQILKSHTEILGGMDIYRTTKAGALAENGPGKFNLLFASIIKSRKIENADRTRNVVYKVTMPNDEPANLFPKDRRQTAVAGNDKSVAMLDVKTAGPSEGNPEDQPGAEFTSANPLINSDDSRVIQAMRRAVGSEKDEWKKAVAIQKWVSQNVRDKNFSTAFANASEVARNLKGDCTEHSVLVAAMCRAAGIPARCAVGVVYGENIAGQNLNGFVPHMWNEVYVNRRWVAIDAAYNQSDVDATHLKFAASSLEGVSPFEVFLPVLKVFTKITIEPVEVR